MITATVAVAEIETMITELDARFGKIAISLTSSDLDLRRAQVVAQGRAALIEDLIAARLHARQDGARLLVVGSVLIGGAPNAS